MHVQARGKPVRRPVSTVDWSAEEAERGKFPHYMLKEIYEQPARVADVLRRTLRPRRATVEFRGAGAQPGSWPKIRRLVLVACGTSWHAALVGEYLIETLARLPVEVEYGSEMRYRNRPIEKRTLVVSISQSGETADTLAAIRGAAPKAPARSPLSTSRARPSPANPTPTLHARRAGDRRGLDQGLRDAGLCS